MQRRVGHARLDHSITTREVAIDNSHKLLHCGWKCFPDNPHIKTKTITIQARLAAEAWKDGKPSGILRRHMPMVREFAEILRSRRLAPWASVFAGGVSPGSLLRSTRVPPVRDAYMLSVAGMHLLFVAWSPPFFLLFRH